MISDKIKVPVCRQLLKGWPRSTQRDAQNASTVLKTLNLSKENNIFLTDLTNEGFSDDVVLVSADPLPMYQLRIKYTNENRELNLNFPGTKTILDIQNDVYAVLKVPVRFQRWTGWPEYSSNTTKLSETGFPPVQTLELTRISNESNSNNNRDV